MYTSDFCVFEHYHNEMLGKGRDPIGKKGLVIPEPSNLKFLYNWGNFLPAPFKMMNRSNWIPTDPENKLMITKEMGKYYQSVGNRDKSGA